MSKKVRAFLAIEAGPEIREACVRLSSRLAKSGADVKWVGDENVHLTLKFLGDIDMTDVAEIYSALKRQVSDAAPFEIEVSGAGAFPDLARPRTIWTGVTRGLEELSALHARVEDCLAGLGFRKEARRFSPHLTVGRLREGRGDNQELSDLIAAHADYAVGVIDVEELVLFSSTMERTGAVYEPLARVPLTGKG